MRVGESSERKTRYDTVLMGRKSYEAARRQGGGGAMPGMAADVFSRTLGPADCPDVSLSADPQAVVAALEAKPGKDIRPPLDGRIGGSRAFAESRLGIIRGSPATPASGRPVGNALMRSRVARCARVCVPSDASPRGDTSASFPRARAQARGR